VSNVTVEINGKETVSQAALAAKNGLTGLNAEVKNAEKSFRDNTIAAAAVAAAVMAIAKATAESVKAYAEQERSVAQFNSAMELSGQISEAGAERLRKYADEIANLTGEDDEAILSMEAFLAASGRNEVQIRKLISAAADYSAATGKDLRTSVETLNKTFSGTTEKLGTVIPALKNLTEEELKAGKGIDVVAAQYAGFADKMSGITDVQLKNFKNAWDDVKAAFGAAAMPALSPILTWLTDLANGWANAATKKREYDQIKLKEENGALLTAVENLKKIQFERDMAEAGYRSLISQGIRPEVAKKAFPELDSIYAAIDKALFAVQVASAAFVPTSAGGSGGTSGTGDKDPLAKFIEPIRTGPLSAAGYSFARQFYEQFGAGLADIIPEFRDDLENYGWSAEMLAAPIREFRDDLESYGWTGDELARPIKEFRDDLESYGWDSGMLAAMLDAGAEARRGASAYSAMWNRQERAGGGPVIGTQQLLSDAWANSDMIIGAASGIGQAIVDGIESTNIAEAILADLQAEFTKPQNRLTPEGFATGRDDLYEQLGTVPGEILAVITEAMEGFKPATETFQIGAEALEKATNPAIGERTGIAGFQFGGAGTTAVREGEPSFLAGLAAAIMPVVDGLLGMVTPLASVQAILNPLQTIFSAMMDVLGPLINTVLMPIVGILRILGATIGQMLAPVISALGPIIKVIGDAFVWLYNNAIRPFANAVIWVGNALYNGIAKVLNFLLGWLGVSIDEIAMNNGSLAEINAADLTAAGGVAGATAGSYGAGATYEKPRDITINVSVETAALVGEGGITEFAMILKREFASLGVLNMGTT